MVVRLYPSSTAFMTGDLVFTRYSSGCLRSILLAKNGVRESVNEIHGKRGAINEDRYAAKLTAADMAFEREVAFKHPISADAEISGRIDFIVGDAIHELKSSESPTVIREVIKNGKVKSENVCQTVLYMMAKGLSKGRLIYTGYKFDKKTQEYVEVAERVFSIWLDIGGDIYVDDVKFEFKAEDIVSHLLAAAGVVSDRRIATRPYGSKNFDGPCKYCPFSGTCELWDDALISSTEEFIDMAKQELQQREMEKKSEKVGTGD